MFRILKSTINQELPEEQEQLRSDYILVDSFKSMKNAQGRLDELNRELQKSRIVNEKYWIEEYNVVKNGDSLVDIGGLDYDFVDDFFYGRAIVRRGKHIGIINEQFEEILFCDEYSKIERFENRASLNEPAAIVHYDEDEHGHGCYIDLYGNFIVRVGLFEKKCWLYRIPSEGIFFAYNSISKWVLVRLYPDSSLYDYDSESYRNEGRYTFYNIEKKRFMLYGGNPGPEYPTVGPYTAVSNFMGDVAIIECEDKQGLIDSNEVIIVEPKYEKICQFSDGLAAFKTAEEKKYYKDGNGKLLIKTINEGNKWGFIDKSGNEVISAQFDGVSSFFAGNAAFKVGKKWGFINTAGEQIIAPVYDYFFGFFRGGVAIVGEHGKFGLLSATLKESTGLLFSNVEFDHYIGNYDDIHFDEPCFIVSIGGYYDERYGWVDCDEQYLVCFRNGQFVKMPDKE